MEDGVLEQVLLHVLPLPGADNAGGGRLHHQMCCAVVLQLTLLLIDRDLTELVALAFVPACLRVCACFVLCRCGAGRAVHLAGSHRRGAQEGQGASFVFLPRACTRCVCLLGQIVILYNVDLACAQKYANVRYLLASF